MGQVPDKSGTIGGKMTRECATRPLDDISPAYGSTRSRFDARRDLAADEFPDRGPTTVSPNVGKEEEEWGGAARSV
ncbi:hypothetical protein KM043_000787 [Ampulex compressa]|nr:hypothetical protein KM043_000787 [Ampulex compressa]